RRHAAARLDQSRPGSRSGIAADGRALWGARRLDARNDEHGAAAYLAGVPQDRSADHPFDLGSRLPERQGGGDVAAAGTAPRSPAHRPAAAAFARHDGHRGVRKAGERDPRRVEQGKIGLSDAKIARMEETMRQATRAFVIGLALIGAGAWHEQARAQQKVLLAHALPRLAAGYGIASSLPD